MYLLYIPRYYMTCQIDVELMEMEVLKGGIDFINKFGPIMWLENHSYYPNQINKFLLSNNYNS